MSLDPVLLARSWPERRPVVLASAALGLVAVAVAAAVGDRAAIGGLYVLPVILVALELGLGGGVAAAALAIALLVAGDAPGGVPTAIAGMAARGAPGAFS